MRYCRKHTRQRSREFERPYRGTAAWREASAFVIDRDAACSICHDPFEHGDQVDVHHTPEPWADLVERYGSPHAVPLEVACDVENLAAAHAACNRGQGRA